MTYRACGSLKYHRSPVVAQELLRQVRQLQCREYQVFNLIALAVKASVGEHERLGALDHLHPPPSPRDYEAVALNTDHQRKPPSDDCGPSQKTRTCTTK